MYAIHPQKMVGNQVCIKEEVNGYEVSISFNDSNGTQENCTRGDIRVFYGDEDITSQISSEVISHAEGYKNNIGVMTGRTLFMVRGY